MSVRTATRRKQQRHWIRRHGESCVEFKHPGPNGRPYRLPLVNVSIAGISFALDGHDDLALIEPGTRVEGASIHIETCELRGDLVMMHITPGTDQRGMCGALFYPASDSDLIKLRSVIAGMEALG